MQIVKLLFIVLFSVSLSGETGIYSQVPAGKTVIIKPKPNQAFSMRRSSGTAKNFGLYDIVIKNGNDILFEDRNLRDETYFIFNEMVDPNDRLEATVKRGSFDYKVTSTQVLPNNIKKVLKEERPKRTKPKITKPKKQEQKIVKKENLVKPIEQNISVKEETTTQPAIQKDENLKPPTDYLSAIGSFFSSILSDLASIFPTTDTGTDEVKKEIRQDKEPTKVDIDSKQPNFKSPVTSRQGVKDVEFTVDTISHDKPTYNKNEQNVPKENQAQNEVYTKTKNIITLSNETKPKASIATSKESIGNTIIPVREEIAKTAIEKSNIEPKIKEPETVVVEPEEETKIKNDKKIVITKIIDTKKDQQEEDKFADRVLGTGYKSKDQGTLKVVATSNDKPVAAWVEVYRAGTKQRVKTFYTSTTRIAKKITLPSGDYTVKTTYRKASMKQQKILKNIDISDGQDIAKHISFKSGTLKIVTKRQSKATRAKVEIYKYRSKRLYTYAFTSKISGEINIILPEGKYDIIIKEFKNKKRVRGLYVRGGKTRRINVAF